MTLISIASLGIGTHASPGVRDVSQYNQSNGTDILHGHDPVSYFNEGGGIPMLGQPTLQLDYMGVTYYFASQSNLDQFLLNPAKYEPSYGGWCAYAMASGTKIMIDPMFYTIDGNRLHFFVNGRAKANFDRDVAGHEMRADGFWKTISGEEPRL